tara:strand:+ start:236 stop:421 length:186 start_codon:yes stop_codon:yes gene_type:complete
MEKIRIPNNKYICPECKGNGYNRIAKNMVVQCEKCKSQGELKIEAPTIEELNETAKKARLQ